MRFLPHLPFPHITITEDVNGQKVPRVLTAGGNVNSFATAVLLIAAMWCVPTSLGPLFWPQVVACLLLLIVAVVYGLRAYEFFQSDYAERAQKAFMRDESRTSGGADSRFADLADLAKAGMLDNPNEFIIGMQDGEPVFAPTGTTFIKLIAQQGAGKTVCFVFPNLIHLMNTRAKITQDIDHAALDDVMFDGFKFDDVEPFETAELDDLDPYFLEGELFDAA